MAEEYTQIRNIVIQMVHILTSAQHSNKTVEIMKKEKTGRERIERKSNNTEKVCLQKERAKPG